MHDPKKKTENLISVLLLVLALCGTAFYIFARERAEFNLDYTDTLLWAAASADSGSMVSPDFWYAYIIPFGGQLLMIPLVKLFGVTYFTHELGMTLFTAVLAVAVFFCIKSLGFSKSRSAFVSAVFLLLLVGSPITRMIYYGHIIHYSLAILFTCVAFILLYKAGYGRFSTIENSSGPGLSKNSVCYCILLLCWILLCCLNGSSALLLFLLPLAGALVLERLLDPAEITLQNVKKPLLLLFLILAAALFGFAIKQVFIRGGYNNSYEENFSSFLGHSHWLWEDQGFLLRFVTLLTGWVSDGDPMLSMNGFFVLLRFFLALLLLVIPAFALLSYKKFESRMMKLLVLDYWVLFGLTQLIYSVSYVQTENWRLGALLGMSILLSSSYLLWLTDRRFLCRFGYLGILVVLLASLINVVSVIRLPHGKDVNGYDRLIGVLSENGLTRGYSELWNGANVTTVLSDSQIRISPIGFSDNGSYEINPYQSEASWYEDTEGVSEYFVLVTAGEKEKVSETLVRHAVREIEFEDDQTILVFDRNIFDNGLPVYTK